MALLEDDFDFYMGYHSNLPCIIPWSELRTTMTERFQFELNETPTYIRILNSTIHSACYSPFSVDSDEIATNILDDIEFPHHNVPNPPNPYSYPKDDRDWRITRWKEVKPTQRKSSKTLKVAFERCLRRCLYFLFQVSLEKYWPPPGAALCFERTNVDVYVSDSYKQSSL